MSQNSVSTPWYIPHRYIPQIPTLHGQSCPTPKTDSANNRLALKGGEESPKILHSTEKKVEGGDNYLPKKYDDSETTNSDLI